MARSSAGPAPRRRSGRPRRTLDVAFLRPNSRLPFLVQCAAAGRKTGKATWRSLPGRDPGPKSGGLAFGACRWALNKQIFLGLSYYVFLSKTGLPIKMVSSKKNLNAYKNGINSHIFKKKSYECHY
jgi:hypothetical protein